MTSLPMPVFASPHRFSRARVVRCVTALVAASLLAACGGGTRQIEPFKAERYFAMGDELSVLTSDGRRHGINGLNSSNAVDCSSNQIWVQALASSFSLVFAECNPNAATELNARILAAPGADAAALTAQIDAQVAAGGFRANDLTSVLIGMHDVLALYAQFPARSEADLTNELGARGAAIAAQVNRLVGLGAKVVVSTVPDLGTTPFALAEKAAHSDVDRSALLSRLTAALNARLRTTILNDGRFIGLVLADEMTEAMVRSPLSFGLTDISQAACAVALPDCTSATLVAGANASTWLWADRLRLAPTAQTRLGLLAQSRALGNPF
jgi:hypothetical protein